MDNETKIKYQNLSESIKKLGKAIVAFSGGIDSTLVLKAAHDALGKNAIAVTADSPSVPRNEIKEAKKIAEIIGARHAIINTEETKNENYLKNPANRCYYCKSELYFKLRKFADELKIKNILNGTNLDDLGDYRPGLKAAEENNVLSPLANAKISKKDVREIAKHLGIPIWDKPASPCLASRIPYGQEVTLKKLAMVEDAENYLKDFGIKELRVRHFGSVARIEVPGHDRETINKNFDSIKNKFNELGFNEIIIADFRSGSLNLAILQNG